MSERHIPPLIVSGETEKLGESLAKLRQYVTAAADSGGLSAAATHRLRLAIDEIATNIITHGYAAAAARGFVEVSATISVDAVTISLDDTAIPFNPLEQPVPANLTEPLERRHEGGLGVYLALKSVDEFRYDRVGGHNRSSFVIRRDS
jgi:anti-sigma regulatory factor (Ser/Thr protein kinase)